MEAKTVETGLIDTHRTAGVGLGVFSGVVLPKGFSDFATEYRAGAATAALFDTGWHVVLVLTGRDRLSYLHNISSNDIRSLAEGRGTLALLLSPQGRILAELEIYALPGRSLVLSHISHRERTVATLRKYIIGSDVQIQDESDQVGSLAVEGPQAEAVISEICGVKIGPMPEMSIEEIHIDGVPAYLLRRSHFGRLGAEFITVREALPALWGKSLGVARARDGEPIGMAALEALRLEAGVAWFPADFNDGMIPHEAALENTHISFHKGCYTGQEIVERVRSRGHVNRRRVWLKFSTTWPPPAGTKLRARDAEVGFVTSSAFSPATGTAVGMGYVRREQLAPGSVIEFDGGQAEVGESQLKIGS